MKAAGSPVMLLAVEAVPQSQRIIAAAVKLAVQSKAEVLVLSVRERGYARGLAWDVRPVGEVAEVVSQALYELQRADVPARGLVVTARVGKVADEIGYVAERHQADVVVLGLSRRSWLGRLLQGSVSPRVLQHSTIPVVAIPWHSRFPAGQAADAKIPGYRSATDPKR